MGGEDLWGTKMVVFRWCSPCASHQEWFPCCSMVPPHRRKNSRLLTQMATASLRARRVYPLEAYIASTRDGNGTWFKSLNMMSFHCQGSWKLIFQVQHRATIGYKLMDLGTILDTNLTSLIWGRPSRNFKPTWIGIPAIKSFTTLVLVKQE